MEKLHIWGRAVYSELDVGLQLGVCHLCPSCWHSSPEFPGCFAGRLQAVAVWHGLSRGLLSPRQVPT